MTEEKVSGFLGESSFRHKTDLFSTSIVNYYQLVSEEWHYHEDFHLSSILVGGNRESRKAGDIQVKPGKIMVYHEGEIHRNRNTLFPSKNLNIEIAAEFFNDELKQSNLKLDIDSYFSLLKVYQELSIKDANSDQSIQQTLKGLFYKEVTGNRPDWIDTLQTLLRDRWQEFISLDELSSEAGLHPVTISKTFAKHERCTITDYMRKLKVEQAIHLLFNSRDSLTEIAHYCGFSDQSHMTRLFKHYLGISPKRLRAI